MDRRLISKERINSVVTYLAQDVSAHYIRTGSRDVLAVGVLNGAFMFMADLVRRMSVEVDVDFIRLASYDGTESGHVSLIMDLRSPIEGRDVLIVEDIVDTGRTIDFLIKHLYARNPRSIQVCTLLDKPSGRRIPIKPDFVGMRIPNIFVYGYGLDNAVGRGRYLPNIMDLDTSAL